MKVSRTEGLVSIVLTTALYGVLMKGHLPKDAWKTQLIAIGGSALLQLPFSEQGEKGKWILRILPFMIIGVGSYFGKVPRKISILATIFFGLGHVLVGEGIRYQKESSPPPPSSISTPNSSTKSKKKKQKLEKLKGKEDSIKLSTGDSHIDLFAPIEPSKSKAKKKESFEAVRKRVMKQTEAPTEEDLEVILKGYGRDNAFELKLIQNFNMSTKYSEKALELARAIAQKFSFENRVKLLFVIDLCHEDPQHTGQFCSFLDKNIDQVTLGMLQFLFQEDTYRSHQGFQTLFLKHFSLWKHWDEKVAENYVTVAEAIDKDFPKRLIQNIKHPGYLYLFKYQKEVSNIQCDQFKQHFLSVRSQLNPENFRKYYVTGQKFKIDLFELIKESDRQYFRFLGIKLDESGYVGVKGAADALGNPTNKGRACIDVAKGLGYHTTGFGEAKIFTGQLLKLIDTQKAWIEAFQEVGPRFREVNGALSGWIESRRKEDGSLPANEQLMSFKEKASRSRPYKRPPTLREMKVSSHISLGSFSLGASSSVLAQELLSSSSDDD